MMELQCRVALMKSRQDLIRDLDVKPATDFLLSRLAISQEESSRVFDKSSAYCQRRVLLDLLPEKGPEVFKIFMEYLAETQHWLCDSINRNIATVTQEELDKVGDQYGQLSTKAEISGPTAQELQQALRRNIDEYIQNDPSRVLEGTNSFDYINQPIEAHKMESGKNPEKIQSGSILDLLHNCDPVGQRVFIYGSAGMGKTSLCRHVARMWVGEDLKFSEQFDYAFPIPMRAVRSHSLVDIICNDTGLIPETSKKRIAQELGLKQVLFILDSFEELSFKTPEINKLIKRELFPKSSVLITARPGYELEEEERQSTPCIRVHLENFTEDQVNRYLANYPGLQKGVQLGIEEIFGMGFLRKPINLWLLCMSLTHIAKSAGIPNTQTVLLNTIFQRLMLAYSKKKNLSDVNLTPESPYKKQKLSEYHLTFESPMKIAPTEVKVMLEKVGQLCYFGLRDKTRILVIDDGVLSKVDVMAMGLFSEGGDGDSVTLPHPLFQEYLAALFLSVNQRTRKDLFKELRVESESSSPKPSLDELLRPRGFDNMIRFLVGLSPRVAEDVSGLLVIKQVSRHMPLSESYQNDLGYELGLLRECSVEECRSVIAAALLEAPVSVRDEYFIPQNTDSHLLLHCFGEEQSKEFLKKLYGCQICNHELVRTPDSRHFWLDSFVVGMIYLHNCSVGLNKVWFTSCRVPVSLLTDRLAAVEDLKLEDGTLCEPTESEFLASLNVIALSHSSTEMPLRQREMLLSSVTFIKVEGLNLLSTQNCTLPTARTLVVTDCGDVNLGSLCQCFTGVCELILWSNKRVNTDNAGQQSSVRKLHLHYCDSVDLINLKKIFVQLEKLMVDFTALKIEQEAIGSQTQWHTVRDLELSDSHLYTDEKIFSEEEARQFLTHFCSEADMNMITELV